MDHEPEQTMNHSTVELEMRDALLLQVLVIVSALVTIGVMAVMMFNWEHIISFLASYQLHHS